MTTHFCFQCSFMHTLNKFKTRVIQWHHVLKKRLLIHLGVGMYQNKYSSKGYTVATPHSWGTVDKLVNSEEKTRIVGVVIVFYFIYLFFPFYLAAL